MKKTQKESKGGRPPKFDEPSRPVTLTLPERTLEILENIDSDRAWAIVKATDLAAGEYPAPQKRVELLKITSDKALIIVTRNKPLRHIRWLRVVEVSPGQFLLVIPTGTAVETLEIELLDLLNEGHVLAPDDRDFLQELLDVLSHHRRRSGMSRAEILFVSV